MYERGDGVQQDFAQAIHLYKQAAAQGDVDAQNNLARLLQKE
jgi:TPR repeat protein